MPPHAAEPNLLLLAFNVVLGLAGVFGGIVLRGIISDMKSLNAGHLELTKQQGQFATRAEVKADVADVRVETRQALAEIQRGQQDGFRQVFEKLDQLQRDVAIKADRSELR